MNPIIALPHHPVAARNILPLEDTRQAAHLQRRNIMPEPAAAPGYSPDRIPQRASPPLRGRGRRQENPVPCGDPVLHGIMVPASP